MAQTVRNWPDNCDPRTPCFGVLMTGKRWPMPWSWAAQLINPHPDHADLPKCLKLISDVPGDTPNNLVWDNPINLPSLQATVTLRGEGGSPGFDGDFGWYVNNTFEWRIFATIPSTVGTASFETVLFRGDVDLQIVDLSWTGKALFEKIGAACLGHDLQVDARSVCEP